MTPHIEEGIIGSVVMYGTEPLGMCIAAGCEPDWFLEPRYRAAYEVCVKRFAEGKPIGVAQLCPPLTPVDVNHCMEHAIIVPHMEWSLSMMKAQKTLRAATDMAAQHVSVLKTATDETSAAVLQQIQADWLQLDTHDKPKESLSQIGKRLVDEWAAPAETRKAGIAWPIERMNRVMVPVTDDYCMILARPSVGKTALALQWSIQCALAGIPVGYASLESGLDRIVPRLLSQLARVDTLSMKRGYASTEEYARARTAAEKLRTLPLRFTDAGMTIEQVRAWAMLEKNRGTAMLIIDNLKHIRPSQKYGSVVEQFRDMSAKLKWLRDDLRIPIVVLHHTNKAGEASWSDDIERDMDVLLSMTEDEERSIKPDYTDPQSPNPGKTIVEIEAIKNRDGVRHTVWTVEYVKRYQTFEEETR